jgi:hypothetical protein
MIPWLVRTILVDLFFLEIRFAKGKSGGIRDDLRLPDFLNVAMLRGVAAQVSLETQSFCFCLEIRVVINYFQTNEAF